MLRLRPRNQHRGGHDKVHAPKLLVLRDVLRGNASRALRKGVVVSCLLLISELMLGMSVKKSAVAAQCKHEQQLGIHSRRRHLSGGQALDCGGESITKEHSAISTQQHATGSRSRDETTAAVALGPREVRFHFAAAVVAVVVAAVIRATTAR